MSAAWGWDGGRIASPVPGCPAGHKSAPASPMCTRCGQYGLAHVDGDGVPVRLCLMCADVLTRRDGLRFAPADGYARSQYAARTAVAPC